VLLVALGRGEAALAEAQQASLLDPLAARGVVAMQRYAHWLMTGERPHLQQAPRQRRPFLKVEPGDPWALAREGDDLAQAGECAPARQEIEKAQRLAPDNVKLRLFVAKVDWMCGDRARARELLDDMKRRPDADEIAFHAALLHVYFGERDSAFVWLDHQRPWTVAELSMLSASHYLDPLRADPRFAQLLRRLRLRK
jgi:Flp pilus assembly protein TadD